MAYKISQIFKNAVNYFSIKLKQTFKILFTLFYTRESSNIKELRLTLRKSN